MDGGSEGAAPFFVVVFEVDTPSVLQRKVSTLLQESRARQVLGSPIPEKADGRGDEGGETTTEWQFDRYRATALDLRDIAATTQSAGAAGLSLSPSDAAPLLHAALRKVGFVDAQETGEGEDAEQEVHTLVLAECVLSYLPRAASDAVLNGPLPSEPAPALVVVVVKVVVVVVVVVVVWFSTSRSRP